MNDEAIKMVEKKIGGFDAWEVENAAETLLKAKEMPNRPKFYAVVLKEVGRIAKTAAKVALEKKVAAKLLKLGE